MNPAFREALAAGYERMSAWAELLDRINVFPVADGDTGRNLAGSLAPLRRLDLPAAQLVPALLLSARGNSGNIGARFMEGFLGRDGGTSAAAAPQPPAVGSPTDVAAGGSALLAHRCRQGSQLARSAVAEPKAGTMLSFFEELEHGLDRHPLEQEPQRLNELLDDLEQVVHHTTEQLPKLKEAGVVDAGALGMYLFVEGFLNRWLARPAVELRDIAGRFPAALAFSGSRLADARDSGFCIDVVLRAAPGATAEQLSHLGRLGDEVVAMRHGDMVKLHLHVDDPARLRQQLEQLGSIQRWSADDLAAQTRQFAADQAAATPIHVVTDAAGSLTREDAQQLGVTLLDSYVQLGSLCLPETCLQPADLYAAMRAGVKVSTSQASVFERHQHYQMLLRLHRRVLYLCVGSFFTGNHAVVTQWRQLPVVEGDRLTVLDTGAASGRLGVIAIATARYARRAATADAVIDFAHRAIAASREYIFLDKLHWLAAGGRLSKTSAFFGDLLQMKPVISPTAEGAKKVAVVRSGASQLSFAMERLGEALGSSGKGLILLEYSDNRATLAEQVLPALTRAFPEAEVKLQPFSLTSGAHMGPGTWAVAVLPGIE